jgi:hypothetical protein
MTATDATNIHEEHAPIRPSYDDINTPVIFMVGIISAIVTIVIIAFVQGLCYHWQSSFTAAQDQLYGSSIVKPIIDAQKKDLEGGESRVPITEAMNRIVQKYGKPVNGNAATNQGESQTGH